MSRLLVAVMWLSIITFSYLIRVPIFLGVARGDERFSFGVWILTYTILCTFILFIFTSRWRFFIAGPISVAVAVIVVNGANGILTMKKFLLVFSGAMQTALFSPYSYFPLILAVVTFVQIIQRCYR